MKDQPHPVDVYVGSRVRQRRALLGITQVELAEATGMSYQQIQKYETGANRISASKLFQFSEILEVAPGYFFEEMPDDLVRMSTGLKKKPAVDSTIEITGPRSIEVFKDFHSIDDPNVKAAVRGLIRVCARND